MQKDTVYLVVFVALVVIFFWGMASVIGYPSPYSGPYLPIKDGVIAVVYGTLPSLQDVSIIIGNKWCLNNVLTTVYTATTPNTSVAYVVVRNYMVAAVIPYEVEREVLNRIYKKSVNGPLYFDINGGVFDYLGVSTARKLTRLLSFCINEYTQQWSTDNTKNDNSNKIDTNSKQ